MLRSGLPINNDFKTIIILYEREGTCKSYKNLTNVINNRIDNNPSKMNKIVGFQNKKIVPNFKNINNNIEIKVDDYNNYNYNNRINKPDNNNKNYNKLIKNEETINSAFSKEQRNSYQKLSKNMNFNINPSKEDKNNFKTDFNHQKEIKTISQDNNNNEENNIKLNINTNKYINTLMKKNKLI